VALYVDSASRRLRNEGLVAGCMHVVLATSRHRPEQPGFTDTRAITLYQATALTPELTRLALEAVTQLHRPGHPYVKAGVIFIDLGPASMRQQGLFEPPEDQRSVALVRAMDQVNDRWGRGYPSV